MAFPDFPARPVRPILQTIRYRFNCSELSQLMTFLPVRVHLDSFSHVVVDNQADILNVDTWELIHIKWN